MQTTEGVQFFELDNGFRVWTKRVGDGPVKILLLHGGPGYTHECFECFEDFFPRNQFQLIYYDQLGSYYSDQPDDPSLWKIERFCEEVEQVRQALGLEGFYLYGYSWGSMLAIEYALRYQSHLKGLVLSNMTASVASYEAHLNKLKTQLPEFIITQLASLEKKGNTNGPEYEQIMLEYIYKQHVCRLDPWPEPVLRSMRHFNKNVCETLFGSNDFVTTGNCKNWDRWNDLANIQVPTLVMGGRHDTMDPTDIERMGSLIPSSQVKICDKGSHLSMYEDQDSYFQALILFLPNLKKTLN